MSERTKVVAVAGMSKEQLQALVAEATAELENRDNRYLDELANRADMTVDDIIAEGEGQDWYLNYFLTLTLNQIADLMKPDSAMPKKGKGKRIPKIVQQYYTLKAISEGASKAKDIRTAYPDFISKTGPWSELAKSGHLLKEGEKIAATYAITDLGMTLMEELKEKI